MRSRSASLWLIAIFKNHTLIQQRRKILLEFEQERLTLAKIARDKLQ